MRKADRIVAAALFFLGIGVAWKSTELPIGILPREGPGGGFFPFWLSVGISALAVLLIVQSYVRGPWDRGMTDSEVEEAHEFIPRVGLLEILRVGVPGLIMILLIGVISVYVSAAVFIFYCLYIVGRHKLVTSLAVTLGVPIVIYFLFEKFLIIPLPKGYLEFLFYWS